MNRSIIAWSGLLCACLIVPAALGQGLVSNGSFDSDASGWTAQNIGGIGGYDYKGNPGGCFILDAIPSPDTDPTISQTIYGLTLNATYRISGEYKLERDWGLINSEVPSFGVSLNGVQLFEGMRPSDWNRWNTFDVNYTASSTSAVLAFAAQRNGSGVSYGIDNIFVRQVPEPAVVSLVLVGAMIFVRTRRKHCRSETVARRFATGTGGGANPPAVWNVAPRVDAPRQAACRSKSPNLFMKTKFPLLFVITALAGTIPVQAATWTTNALLTAGRAWHTATLLPSGLVLIAGGNTTGSAELFDPENGATTATGPMNVARLGHTAVLLPNGKVLVVGGGTHQSGIPLDSYCLDSAELYNPDTGTWTPTGSLHTRRGGHTMSLLTDGRVLVAGGIAPIGGAINSAEVYDPAIGTWTVTGSLTNSRCYHTATLLPDGKVLVVGGNRGSLPPPYADVAMAELYDPVSGTWSQSGSLGIARGNHTATLLPDGKVLVIAGVSSYQGIASAELYNPTNHTWTTAGSLAVDRFGHSATLLPNGKVLVAGGNGTSGFLASTEVYDPTTGIWTSSAAMNALRAFHTATLLTNGNVLVTGGYTDRDDRDGTNSTEVFDYSTTPVPVQSPLADVQMLNNGSFRFTFTNTPGATLAVLSSTNLSDPLSTWTHLGGAMEVIAGRFEFADAQAINFPRRFYCLTKPQ